jgi:hypothetical protein
MTRLALLCAIAAVMCHESSAKMGSPLVGHSPEVISRLNYGVYFRKIATLDISAQTWTHIFRVQIPRIKVSSPQISSACISSVRSPQFCQGHTAARRLIMNAYRTVVKMYEKLNSDVIVAMPQSSDNWRNTSKPKRNVFHDIGGFVGK